MLDTVLFDLDGTLLPMDMDAFMKLYSTHLSAKLAEFGFGDAMDALWEGTARMVRNNGEKTNEAVFWESFSSRVGQGVLALQPQLELFYENEFNAARAATQPNPLARPLVRGLRAKGYTLVLATNPLFPRSAVHTRLGWIGLGCDDFDHITTYDICHYSKPDVRYYGEILQAVGCRPESCLMVGNDAEEDAAATGAGLGFYLVTDHLLNPKGLDVSGYRQGRFASCCRELGALPARAG